MSDISNGVYNVLVNIDMYVILVTKIVMITLKTYTNWMSKKMYVKMANRIVKKSVTKSLYITKIISDITNGVYDVLLNIDIILVTKIVLMVLTLKTIRIGCRKCILNGWVNWKKVGGRNL